jgi:hypothetical protein
MNRIWLVYALVCAFCATSTAHALSYKKPDDMAYSQPPCPSRHCPKASIRTPKRKAYNPFTEAQSELIAMRVWMTFQQGHMTMDLRVLDMLFESTIEQREDLRVGGKFQAFTWRQEIWFSQPQRGEHTFSEWKGVLLAMRVGNPYLWMNAGFWGVRVLNWELPENQAEAMQARLQTTETSSTLNQHSILIFLPRVQIGLRVGGLQVEAHAELLSWSLNSGLLGASATYKTRTLTAQLATTWREDALRFRLARNKGDDAGNGFSHAQLLRRIWDTELNVKLDILGVLSRRKRPITGPVFVSVGARYRHHILMSLQDKQQTTLFAKQPGGEWSFQLGLQLAWGISPRQR